MFFRKKKIVAVQPMTVPTLETVKSKETGAPRKKILVVDDDPITVKTLALTLNARGFNVVCAADGPQAIGVMRDEKPDMLLVDVCLPPDVASGGAVPWDGFQVTRWLQQMNNRKIPAIIISGSDKLEYKQKAAAVGANGFMAKPVDNALLVSSVESALANPPDAIEGFLGLKMAK